MIILSNQTTPYIMKTPDFKLHVIPSNLFTWGSDTGTSELSTITGNRLRVLKKIWDDSDDVGFYVHSKKTGVYKLFIWTETVLDANGDLSHYLFHDETGLISVTIFND